jgi:hypothetical protein
MLVFGIAKRLGQKNSFGFFEPLSLTSPAWEEGAAEELCFSRA